MTSRVIFEFMGSERLLDLLLELQSRGRCSARELGGWLGVSERTIYRDLETLCEAGFSVVGQRGRGGGVELEGDALAGLSRSELRARLALPRPSPVGEPFGSAIRSLLVSSPLAAPQGVLLDSSSGNDLLSVFSRAAAQGRRVRLTWRGWSELGHFSEVRPCGLVYRLGQWVAVYAMGGRVSHRPVDDIVGISVCEGTSPLPAGFELSAYWSGVERPVPFWARVRASGEAAERLLCARGGVRQGEDLVLPYESLEAARDDLLRWGGAVLVVSPLALGLSLRDLAERVLGLYGSP